MRTLRADRRARGKWVRSRPPERSLLGARSMHVRHPRRGALIKTAVRGNGPHTLPQTTGESSPGPGAPGAQPSSGMWQMPHTSSSVVQVQLATACHFLMVTFMLGGDADDLRLRGSRSARLGCESCGQAQSRCSKGAPRVPGWRCQVGTYDTWVLRIP